MCLSLCISSEHAYGVNYQLSGDDAGIRLDYAISCSKVPSISNTTTTTSNTKSCPSHPVVSSNGKKRKYGRPRAHQEGQHGTSDEHDDDDEGGGGDSSSVWLAGDESCANSLLLTQAPSPTPSNYSIQSSYSTSLAFPPQCSSSTPRQSSQQTAPGNLSTADRTSHLQAYLSNPFMPDLYHRSASLLMLSEFSRLQRHGSLDCIKVLCHM